MSGDRHEQHLPDDPEDPASREWRSAVERRSAGFLLWLHQAPGWFLPAALVAALLGGLLLEGVLGAALLALVAFFLGWLAFLAWPRLAGAHRILRCAAVAVLLMLALAQLGSF